METIFDGFFCRDCGKTHRDGVVRSGKRWIEALSGFVDDKGRQVRRLCDDCVTRRRYLAEYKGDEHSGRKDDPRWEVVEEIYEERVEDVGEALD